MESINIPIQCPCCYIIFKEEDKFCEKCGFPREGSKEEKDKFISEYIIKQYDKEDAKIQAKEGQLLLFGLAALYLITGFISKNNEDSNLTFFIILSLIYVILGFWVRKNAFAAILTGALLFLGLNVLMFILEPTSIFSGIIVKIVVCSAFFKAFYTLKKFR